MSGDQLAPSFGDPNAQPPTPKQTPTPSIFPSPVFETPKNNQGRFDESPNGWTPRFAEDYSVFNSTPGNLRGTQGPFVDFGSLTPCAQQPSPIAGQKRPYSAEGIAAEIATHVNHFSPNPNLPLPPVEPSRRLQSAAGPIRAESGPSTKDDYQQQSGSQERSCKKVRRSTAAEDSGEQGQGQTVTPPPSACKGQRKLAPKLDTNAMQHDQGFGQQDFLNGGPQQQSNMGAFMTTPSDMFGYPLSTGGLSAPGTEQGFDNQRGFWDADPGMAGMDIDYSGVGNADVFQTPTSAHPRTMESIDWGGAEQMFHATGVVPQPNQENMQGHRTSEQGLASKSAMAGLGTAAEDQSMFVGSYHTPVDNPFGIVGDAGGVNPGLLFSRPPSSSINTTSFSHVALPPSSSAPLAPMSNHAPPHRPAPISEQQTGVPQRGELRRSASVKEMGPGRRADRSIASSPTKATGHPGLSRSFSESRGKRPVVRAPLPALAPAPRPSHASIPAHRPVVSQASRSSGRTSPMKSDHHHRLSSLSSIPESMGTGPRTRTQAKFTIDANGRARVETTLIVDDDIPPPLTVRKRDSAQPVLSHQHRQWNSSESDDDSSSTDDEPIIIPSRNTSFVLPDPLKVTRRHPFHSSQRSISERSNASYVSFAGAEDPESEAETVVNEQIPTGGKSGDAASELRKLRESRHKQQDTSPTKHRRYTSAGNAPMAEFVSNGYSRHTILSPTTLTESSLPTPSSSRSNGVRCICNRPEVDRDGDGFMVQCESCEMWLHGRCVNITKRTLPSVYICLFCANTPNMRGGRLRDNGRVSMGPPHPGSAASPLAHKSFKSFR